MIDPDRLIACALGGDDDGVEEHILGCSECAERFAAFVRISPALSAAIRAGELGFIGTRSLVDRLDRVDLTRGHERFPDIPFERAAARIYVLSPAVVVRRFPTMKLAFRVLAIDGTTERTLGEYTLDHTAP